jgi:Protein kinase domain
LEHHAVGHRLAKLAGALSLAAAAVVLGLGLRPAGPVVDGAAFDGAAWERALGERLRETAAAVHARVVTLAELPRVAAAVSTDAETVRDLTQDELAFRLRPGETMVLGQISKGAVARRSPTVLLLAPERSPIPPLDAGRAHLRIVGGILTLSEAVPVTPRERADELDGVVAVAWPVDLSDLERRLTEAGARVELAAPGGMLALGATRDAAGARRTALALPEAGDGELHAALLAIAPRARARPPIAAALALAIVLAGLGVLLLVRRRPRKGEGISRISPTPISPTPISPTPVSVPGAPIGAIGRYELLRPIGRGGMAQVYLARATGAAGFAKLLALKVLQPELASQPQVVQHFLDEAQLAAQLDHPNVVQTVDLGRAGEDYFIAMEYVDGADLARLIEVSHDNNLPVPLPIALGILRRICDGLHAAHTALDVDDATPLSVVHRDVKSANVFVARSGVVKVGDFGIAKANRASRISRTEIGLVKGTPGYMAPEQRLAQPIDARADLYGVGAIAYELLMGEPVNLDLAILADKGREGWPHLPPISTRRADVPPQMEAIVMKALRYDREERFPDCAQLEWALEAVANLYPPAASEKTIALWVRGLLGQTTPERRAADGRVPA